MRLLSSVVIFLILFALGSCDIINPAEPVPTFVRIDSFAFKPTTTYVGSASHKITSVWVYFDNKNIGVFDLPATIPIIAEQAGRLRVAPGVTYSGLNDVLTPYPFYTADTMTLSPASGKMVAWIPQTGYLPDSQLNVHNVDFEAGTTQFLHIFGQKPLTVVSTPDLVFEGQYAGNITLNNDTSSENIMNQTFLAPTESYVELNYKGTLPFEIGMQSTTGSGQSFIQYLFGYKPRSDWNKVYIGLQDFILANPGKQYSVVIRVAPGGAATGYVSFDNFKVITRKQ